MGLFDYLQEIDGIMIQIKLKKGKEESLLRRHLWVFSGAIHSASGEVEEGELVEVVDSAGQFLGLGHSAIGSISVRMVSFLNEPIDAKWWQNRIENAFQARKISVIDNNTTCFRLVHGEGDMLPGLVVDMYGQVAVMQCHSVGMYLQRENIVEALKKVLGQNVKAIYDKSSGTIPPKCGIETFDGYLYKEEGFKADAAVLENGHKFYANWEEGQKTGFFLDQRDNRALVQHYAKGRRVLNTFCYTGGFSVYALAGGATKCVSVDSSEKAIAVCKKNIELNNPVQEHAEVVADVMDYIKEIEEFDLVILDPPAFAKHHKSLGNALQGYKRLNARAMERMPKGSILFTFSCSQAVNSQQFRQAIFSAAAIAKREVRILHQLTQGSDHPINIYHPEGEYLKGLVLLID